MEDKKIEKEIETKSKITWCPGCPNFLILDAFKRTISNLIAQGYKKEDFVIVADIGCNAKIYDYVNLSGFNALHGRVLPTGFGIKIGNPNLKIVCFAGDGGTFNEGLNHFIQASRYNANMTLIVHNNQVFSLTTGQATATTEQEFVEKSHPFGVKEKPLNPIWLALESGASFVARVSALDVDETRRVMEEAIKHKGFSFVEILQPCLIYHDFSGILRKCVYKISEGSFENAVREARKWNYQHDGHKNFENVKIPVGIFFRKQEPTFEEKYLAWKLRE